uniref:Histone-lysine N-methyltransferase eggless n=1 Tax=Sipha flava TaxID=143950 RepID=A0A2S2Q4Z7_9HEMI
MVIHKQCSMVFNIFHFVNNNIMAQKCINYQCKSKFGKKFLSAQQSVCNYYHVPFKPYQKVCSICLEICIKHFNRLGKQMKSQECIFNNEFPARHIYIELSDSDDEETEDNIATSILSEDIHENDLSNYIKTVWYDFIKNPVDLQLQNCKNFINSEKHNINETNNQINSLIKQISIDLSKLHCNLYKFNNCRQFHYEKEVNIIDNNPDKIDTDNDAVVVIKNKTIKPLNLPPKGQPRRCSLRSGDKVYAMKYSMCRPWFEATVESPISKTYFNISFNDDGNKKILNNKNLAYINTSNTQYPIGSRVIAKFQDMNIKLTDNFYVGVIAEKPKYLNNFRYMIFFDVGYTQYVCHEDIRLLCYQSKIISDDVHENVKEFVKAYFNKYPERIMVNFNKKQLVRAELNSKWSLAKVVNTDASLVQLKFFNQENEVHIEWLYRGSNRLGPIYNQLNKNIHDVQPTTSMVNVYKKLNRPYIKLENAAKEKKIIKPNKHKSKKNVIEIISINEFSSKKQTNSGVIETINLPPDRPKPLPYKAHQCSHLCMLWIQYDYSKTKTMNTLSIPLHFGFERTIIQDENLKSSKVVYKTPCGRIIKNEKEMYNYLKTVEYGKNIMTIDFFNFDYFVNPLALYKETEYFNYIDDISFEMESKQISAVNCLNHTSPPPLKYITEREIKPGVNLNLDTKFLCSCDCTDNCENKTKCSCWQLTYECQKKIPINYKDNIIGYNYKRLYETVYTGIYECNAYCKCKKTCLNRVVQEPLSSTLQIFLTEKKGWGVRTLVDIPKGSFVCTYIGAVYKEKEAEIHGMKYGDEYQAELDYIEIVQGIKEGYETDADQLDIESDSKSSSSSEEEEFNPGQVIKSKIPIESKMSLRQNIQNTNKKTDGKHQLSKLNIKQKIGNQKESLRKYFDYSGTYILDAKFSGNVGRYFNHSCDPNIFVQNVFVDSHDLRFPWVAYFALTYIAAGTELTWNYSYTVGSVKTKY